MHPNNISQVAQVVTRTGLKERSIRGATITLGTQVLSHCITVVSVAVLARLLTPEDYGCVAMVTAFTGFLNLFRDLGLSGATIQKKDITHDQVSYLFFVNAAFGAAMTLCTMACAPLVAWFYGKPHLVGVTLGLSCTMFISSLGAQHTALLNRQMRFRTLAVVQITTLLAGLGAALSVALNNGGYWALVANNIASALWSTSALWLASGFRPSWPQKGTEVRKLLRFGASIAGFDIAYYFRDNVDKILLGRMWGAQSLGLYEKAFSLLALPVSSLRYPLNKVAFPALSKLAHDHDTFRAYFMKYCSVLASASMPLVAIMFACSDSIVRLLLGSRWVGAADLFRILAVAGFIETVGTLRTTVILGSGLGKRLFWWGVLNAGGTIIAVLVGLYWGPRGVAIAYCLGVYAMFHPLMAYAFHGTAVRTKDFYRAIANPCIASICMLGAYFLLVLPLLPKSDIVRLSVAVPVCGSVYLAIYAVLPGGLLALREFWGYQSVLFARPTVMLNKRGGPSCEE